MQFEYFENNRDFNIKFPSKFYICAFCGKITTHPKLCIHCFARADGFLKTMDSGYKYQIANEPPQEIFKPLELTEGENNATGNNQR